MASSPAGARSHREQVALFRHGVIGSLLGRSFEHGELRAELRILARKRWRPPGSPVTRSYGVSTIERWFYAFKRGGLEALEPAVRSDRGRARALCPETRGLVLDIRREHPNASSPLILRTLEQSGVLSEGAVSSATLNRLFADHGLPRRRREHAPKEQRTRLRWQMPHPGMLWHGDVCHGPTLEQDGQRIPVRIHALLDDASRYIVALEVQTREREMEMLELFAGALVRHGKPQTLYLDNGATYIGNRLSEICARLKVGLRHARPYDPEARGKMERFWRTMREQCLDYVPVHSTLHDVRARLHAWLETYQRAPHAGLLGTTPDKAWWASGRVLEKVPMEHLKSAYCERSSRRVRKDGTLSVDGTMYQVDGEFLTGKTVIVHTCLLPPSLVGPVELFATYKERRFPLLPAVPIENAKRARSVSVSPPTRATGFDPASATLATATGKPAPSLGESE